MTSIRAATPTNRHTAASSRAANWGLKTLSALLPVAAAMLILGTQPAEAASRCKSNAYEHKDAVSFCEGKLQCSKKTPPQVTVCTGRVRDWKCRCKKPKPSGGQNQESLVPGGLLPDEGPQQSPRPDAGDDPAALLAALAAALHSLEGRQQTEVTTPTARQRVPNALAAARGALHERFSHLALARALERERKRERHHRRQDAHREHGRDLARETGTDTGIFEANAHREGHGPARETGDSTGIFQAGRSPETHGPARETGTDTGTFEASASPETRGPARETGDSTGIF